MKRLILFILVLVVVILPCFSKVDCSLNIGVASDSKIGWVDEKFYVSFSMNENLLLDVGFDCLIDATDSYHTFPLFYCGIEQKVFNDSVIIGIGGIIGEGYNSICGGSIISLAYKKKWFKATISEILLADKYKISLFPSISVGADIVEIFRK